jgi:hypothetical protein
MPETVISNEYATLRYYPDKKIVYHTFHKPIGGEEFRKILSRGAELLKEKNASKWLSDDRENMALSPEDTEWSKTEWFPTALKNGWKYWALVVPDDFKARVNMKEFIDTYFKLGVRCMVCVKPEEAMKWLEKVDAQ